MLPPIGDSFYDALGILVVNQVRRRIASGGEGLSWPPTRRGGVPLNETGRLRGSINHLVRSRGSQSEISVGTNVVYAAVHHFGATIRPVNAQMLFIPISAKGRRIGPKPVGERSVRTVTRTGRETYKPVLKRGVDFVLKRSVRIPARPYLLVTPEDVADIKSFVAHELQRRLR